MIADIQIIVDVLKERATHKPDPQRAGEALEALGNIIDGCHDSAHDHEALPAVRHAQQYVESQSRTKK